MKKETLKELFDLEQQLGINQKDRFHNSEEGKKQYKAIFENQPTCNDIKNEETIEELALKKERIINELKDKAIEQLQTRINELIENMKAIAGEKIEPINSVSSVDYPSDNETELITEMDDVYGINIPIEITKTKCCGILPITNENYCPNCGRKIIRK